MLTQLTTDLCRVLRHDMARFDNDASACYDRIIVALGMLAARRCGMPKNAVRLHAEALQFMRYTVKTAYGVSESNYSGTPFAPLFGTGQGSGASPAVWLSLSFFFYMPSTEWFPIACILTPRWWQITFTVIGRVRGRHVSWFYLVVNRWRLL
ncbi:hypothetical protein MHU86_24036 [Fragilaria crotonensis]|nr:hypothetical protein MHU86_24036 [Fragilaria crotonensis]